MQKIATKSINSNEWVIDQKGKLVALVHFNREEITEGHRHLKETNADYVEHEMGCFWANCQFQVIFRAKLALLGGRITVTVIFFTFADFLNSKQTSTSLNIVLYVDD